MTWKEDFEFAVSTEIMHHHAVLVTGLRALEVFQAVGVRMPGVVCHNAWQWSAVVKVDVEGCCNHHDKIAVYITDEGLRCDVSGVEKDYKTNEELRALALLLNEAFSYWDRGVVHPFSPWVMKKWCVAIDRDGKG